VWAQIQHQLAVTGARRGSVAVLLFGCEFKRADVTRDEEFINGILVPECEKLWDRIQSGGPPPEADGNPATAKALAKLFPQSEEGSVSLGGEWIEKADELVRIKSQQKRDAADRLEIENGVKREIADK